MDLGISFQAQAKEIKQDTTAEVKCMQNIQRMFMNEISRRKVLGSKLVGDGKECDPWRSRIG